jgi:hypothetical protein
MRSQGEAEIAIEQGETRYEGVTWTTHAANSPPTSWSRCPSQPGGD